MSFIRKMTSENPKIFAREARENEEKRTFWGVVLGHF